MRTTSDTAKRASMVSGVSKTRLDKASVKEPGLVVELVGPAAAGKSSLIRALTQSNERFTVGVAPRRRRIGDVLHFVSNALSLLPMFLGQYRKDRWFTWEEIKDLVFLKGWHHAFRRQAANGSITLVENSPIFKLTRLHAFGPENMRGQSFDRWWASMLKQWGNTVGMVIWLDAPDEILIERVHARGRWHRIMGMSGKEANEFLARYRQSYERIIPAFTANCGARLIRLDTHRESLGQMRDKVLAAYDLGNGQGGASKPTPVDPEETNT